MYFANNLSQDRSTSSFLPKVSTKVKIGGMNWSNNKQQGKKGESMRNRKRWNQKLDSCLSIYHRLLNWWYVNSRMLFVLRWGAKMNFNAQRSIFYLFIKIIFFRIVEKIIYFQTVFILEYDLLTKHIVCSPYIVVYIFFQNCQSFGKKYAGNLGFDKTCQFKGSREIWY